jgi:Asp-tRNA(Asn)/Glu-tRNA(Gln) amidotransferase A subunit family amidase
VPKPSPALRARVLAAVTPVEPSAWARLAAWLRAGLRPVVLVPALSAAAALLLLAPRVQPAPLTPDEVSSALEAAGEPAQLEAAQFRHAVIKLMWTRFFLTYDFLILPATPFPALRKADCTLEHRNRLLALTAPASLGGLPVLTLPVPLGEGLSTGLQIIVNDPLSPVIPWALARCAAG